MQHRRCGVSWGGSQRLSVEEARQAVSGGTLPLGKVLEEPEYRERRHGATNAACLERMPTLLDYIPLKVKREMSGEEAEAGGRMFLPGQEGVTAAGVWVSLVASCKGRNRQGWHVGNMGLGDPPGDLRGACSNPKGRNQGLYGPREAVRGRSYREGCQKGTLGHSALRVLQAGLCPFQPRTTQGILQGLLLTLGYEYQEQEVPWPTGT